jgi:hypothetical protein
MAKFDPYGEWSKWLEQLDRAYPEHRCPCDPRREPFEDNRYRDEYVIKLCDEVFGARDWRDVRFPDESGSIIEAFAELAPEAQTYFAAAYMAESLRNYFYRSGFLIILEWDPSEIGRGRRRDSVSLWNRSTTEQKLTIMEFCRLLSVYEVAPEQSWLSRFLRSDDRRAAELYERMKASLGGP